jgi:hypothetical protein
MGPHAAAKTATAASANPRGRLHVRLHLAEGFDSLTVPSEIVID